MLRGSTLAPYRSSLVTAFTLIEFLVVIAILAGKLLPMPGRAKQKAQQVQCLNNHRQLTLAWLMYSDDSNDRIPFAAALTPDAERYAWVKGFGNFDGSNPSNWDVDYDIQKSVLWPHCGQAPGIFKCPAEHSFVVPTSGPRKGQRVERVRTKAMNAWMGGYGYGLDRGPGLSGTTWRLYRNLNNLVDPGASVTILFSDQREDQNGGPYLHFDMSGYPDKPEQTQFTDDLLPFYHGNVTSYSFADGHSELKRWKDSGRSCRSGKGATNASLCSASQTTRISAGSRNGRRGDADLASIRRSPTFDPLSNP